MNRKHLIYLVKPWLRLNNLTLVVAGLVALSWLFGTVNTLQKNFLLQQEVDKLDEQIQVAEIEQATLGFQRQYYQSNEYLELQARDKLGRAAPGEKMVLLPKYVAPPEEPVEKQSSSQVPSNFQQWMRFLFGQQS